MSQVLPTDREHHDAETAVRQVLAITLTNAPRLLVCDALAIWGEADVPHAMANRIVRELAILAQQQRLFVAVRGASAAQHATLQHAIPGDQLAFRTEPDAADLYRLLAERGLPGDACMAILAIAGTQIPDGSTAFYVGAGSAPAPLLATSSSGPPATEAILALYGTALAQERAGIAFRSISQGRGIPAEGPYPPEILTGVKRSTVRTAPASGGAQLALPDAAALEMLARRAYAQLVRNILPNGAVVGANSRGDKPDEPNYWFYWQRDGSISLGHLIAWQQEPPAWLDSHELGNRIQSSLDFVGATQRVGSLGTSRYHVTGDPVLGFGNPQLDGPAWSALMLARLAQPAERWPQLKRYLDFLLTPAGQGASMDLWEFNYGRLFTTEFLAHRALLAGADVAARLGQSQDAARYQVEADRLFAGLADFIAPQEGYLRISLDSEDPWLQTISGLDMAVIAAYVSTADEVAPYSRWGRDLDSLAHPAVLATLSRLETAFQLLYQTNREWAASGNRGWGLGRFPEDANDGLGSSGGNPWPLATLWGAQFYYRLAQATSQALGSPDAQLTLADLRQADFFGRLTGAAVEPGRSINLQTWRQTLAPALLASGDAYLNFVAHHVPDDVGVTEQIDRDSGRPHGAPALSWGLSELIATLALRERSYRLL